MPEEELSATQIPQVQFIHDDTADAQRLRLVAIIIAIILITVASFWLALNPQRPPLSAVTF